MCIRDSNYTNGEILTILSNTGAQDTKIRLNSSKYIEVFTPDTGLLGEKHFRNFDYLNNYTTDTEFTTKVATWTPYFSSNQGSGLKVTLKTNTNNKIQSDDDFRISFDGDGKYIEGTFVAIFISGISEENLPVMKIVKNKGYIVEKTLETTNSGDISSYGPIGTSNTKYDIDIGSISPFTYNHINSKGTTCLLYTSPSPRD